MSAGLALHRAFDLGHSWIFCMYVLVVVNISNGQIHDIHDCSERLIDNLSKRRMTLAHR